LACVSDGNNNSAAYSYLANSPLVSQITFKSNSVTRMTTTRQYDYLNRLTLISSQPGASGVPAVSFNYQANQRTKDVLADGSYWIYQYDSLGQATNGVKHFADGTLVPGQQFGYLFDTIGNRQQTTAGGDAVGSGLRLATYSVNNLNQITYRDYPGTNDVVGAALAINSVTVNGQPAWRKGEYFWSTIKSNNTAAAQWEGVTAASGSFTNTGSLFVPQTQEHFSYDADGNQTSDGRWTCTWDGENRLIAMTNNTGVGPKYGLTCACEYQGRRIQKFVATNGVPIYTVEAGNHYDVEMDSATDADGKLDECIELPGKQIEMTGKLSKVRTDPFLSYDANGNLVGDGQYGYGYDCADELTRVTATNQWQEQYAYDGFGRRRVKQTYSWAGGTWLLASETHYVYDGVNVIQERNLMNGPTVTYTRGLDLSGTMEGAGGIGGLLARTDNSGTAYYHSDGNGNVTMLVDASGNQKAKYLYDPFGSTLGTWGTLASANTYRFSSKEVDLQSGLYYYGYRYYEPNLQRWPNQDPIEEEGGLNLYAYVGNNPVNFVDPSGLIDCAALAAAIAHQENNIRGAIHSMSDINQQFENALWSSDASLLESLAAAGYSLAGLTESLSANAAKNATYAVQVSRGTIPVGVIGANTTGGSVVLSGSGIAGPVSAANIGAGVIGAKEAGSDIGQEAASRASTGVQRVLDPYGRLADVQNETGAQMSALTYQTIRGLQGQLANMMDMYRRNCPCKK
jgi:RHS repeat-associated protein